LGSGEALNEHVVGLPWPSKAERNERLLEAAYIVRELLAGRRVTREGAIPVRDAQIWSRPQVPTQLVGAALSPETAERVGVWADGLLTMATDVEEAERIIKAFRRHGGRKPLHAKINVSWAPTENEALARAHAQWRVHAVDRAKLCELTTPEAFEHAAEEICPEDMRSKVLISADLAQHVEWLRARLALGFETLDIHNVGTNQTQFIEAFGKHVLPALRE
jgi:G6PDH family F420-dependent oxidoreductase